jgi:hypothetical protein
MIMENKFYKGQKVICIDKEYGGHWYDKRIPNPDTNSVYPYHYTVYYGKNPDPTDEGLRWYQPDIKYGELCTVTIPQGTPSGLWVQKADGKECVTLHQWFIDEKEWERNSG